MDTTRYICLYPQKRITHKNTVDFDDELTHGKVYDAVITGTNVLEIINDLHQIKQYSGLYFINYDLFNSLSIEEKYDRYEELANLILIEKYPENYNFKSHKIVLNGVERLDPILVQYIIDMRLANSKSKVLEMELGKGTRIKMACYGKPEKGNLFDYVWITSMDTIATLRSQSYQFYAIKQARRNKLKSLLKR